MATMGHRHHVVVGASAAGVAAALSMRSAGFEGSITVVDGAEELPYQRPPLSKSTSDLADPKPIVPRSTYVDHDIELILGEPVASLDEEAGRVVLASGADLQADAVLLATGVVARRLGVPGENLGNVVALRDIQDARVLAARLDHGGPLVVVGGGFIGLELAAVARLRGQQVTVVESMAVPLAGAVGDHVGSLITDMHKSHGVRVLPRRTVVELRGSGDVGSAVLDDGGELEAATVLVGCGVMPHVDLAREAGVTTRDGVIIDALGRTNRSWIWAAGDVASFQNPFTDGRRRIEHWDVATGLGAAVGANMAGAHSPYDDVPYFWSDQYDQHLQMYGRRRPGDRLTMRPSSSPDGFLAFWTREGRVVAAASIGEPRQLRLAKRLLERRIRVREADLADSRRSLKELAALP